MGMVSRLLSRFSGGSSRGSTTTTRTRGSRTGGGTRTGGRSRTGGGSRTGGRSRTGGGGLMGAVKGAVKGFGGGTTR